MLQALVRRPIQPQENPPLLVLLHGLGADEHDLMGLSRELDPRLLVVTLRAPLDYGNGGYAWFEVAWEATGIRANSEQALASRDLVLEVLKGLPEQLGIKPSKLILGGFSQGAIMSLGVTSSEPDLLSGVILLSGRPLPEFVGGVKPEGFNKVPFYVQHGILDQVLPVSGGREIKRILEGEGAQVTYHEYPMGHEINEDSLHDLSDWISTQLG